MCKVLGVTESGYYKSIRNRKTLSRREQRWADVLKNIYALLREDEENANYGMRRIYLGLKNRYGYTGGYRTIVRICHENGLVIKQKRHPNGITKADAEAQKAENRINQDFTASKPNEKWLTDITEIPCSNGRLYFAPVFDCYDGSIVGYHMDTNRQAELCVTAFGNACRKTGASGMILHSDRGSQYTSGIFRETLRKHGAIQSMSGTGRCYDNARMESFFATLKKEKLYRMDTTKMTVAEVRSVIYRYINYYNLRRIYTTNGGLAPMEKRRRYYAADKAA